MTEREMLEEIARREYYAERERKNAELVECMAYAGVILIIVAGLCWICESLWAFARGF